MPSSTATGSRPGRSRLLDHSEVGGRARRFFDVGELTPTSHIAVFRGALNLHNEFFHQPQLVPVFFPEMLFANVRSLLLPVLWFLVP